MPSPWRIREEAARAGLRVQKKFAFGQDYAETLRRWHQRFVQQRGQVLMQGFDTPFFCTPGSFIWRTAKAAFSMRNIDVVQYTLVKRLTSLP